MTPLFSQRLGYKPISTTIQKESIDEALRNQLWNALDLFLFQKFYPMHFTNRGFGKPVLSGSNFETIAIQLWHNYFKKPIDQIPYIWSDFQGTIRNYFFTSEWHSLYDLIEFLLSLQCVIDIVEMKNFVDTINNILEKEFSAYRIINNQVTPIINELEITTIDEAIKDSNKHVAAQEHLKHSLRLLSDRKNPDYRNSIKESISAVEVMCRILIGDPKATLGEAISKIEKKITLHSAFKSALSKLYGYTNDENGIRHSLLEQNSVTFAEAKFMLSVCSAFVSYLIQYC